MCTEIYFNMIIIFQNSVIGALGRMLTTGALSDVTLSATGVNLKAHRIVLAACSQYFAKLFKVIIQYSIQQTIKHFKTYTTPLLLRNVT